MQGTWGWKGVLLSLLVDRNGATVHAFAALDLALKMTPLTLDHRFYMGQETYARVRLVFMRETRRQLRDNLAAAEWSVSVEGTSAGGRAGYFFSGVAQQ